MHEEPKNGFRTGWLSDNQNKLINEASSIRDSTDSFGKRSSKIYKSVADISSQYKHSPERHRLYINGSEFFLQYGSTPKFEDASDTYILKPDPGDVIEYRTAERFRYVVNYMLEVSAAFQTNKALQGDDLVVMGYGDPDLSNNMANANGWFWEWHGSDPEKTVRLTTYRDGVLLDGTKVVTVQRALTVWQRMEDQINWYRVGNRVARQTYTNEGDQINELIAKTSVDDGSGPSRGNFNYVFGVKADATTTGLQLITGSVGINLVGNAEPVLRAKRSIVTVSHSGSGLWEPMFALCINPDSSNVYVNIKDISIVEIDTDVDVEVLGIVLPNGKTNAQNWSVSPYQNAQSTAVQETTDITQFADSTGTLQTSANNHGGYQISLTVYSVSGNGQNLTHNETGGTAESPLYGTDEAVFIAKASAPAQITIKYKTEQQY